MCGQCVLHSTGMTCPMNCPKQLRNGPCGGVRPDGGCEVKPEMRCVWLKAGSARAKLPLGRGAFNHLRPPVDNRLWGTSSWKNLVTGRDRATPEGAEADVAARAGDRARALRRHRGAADVDTGGLDAVREHFAPFED